MPSCPSIAYCCFKINRFFFFKKSFFPIWDCDLLISQFADAFLSHWKLFNRIVSLVQLIGRYFYEIKSTHLSWISWCDWLILDHLLSTVIYIHTVWNDMVWCLVRCLKIDGLRENCMKSHPHIQFNQKVHRSFNHQTQWCFINYSSTKSIEMTAKP